MSETKTGNGSEAPLAPAQVVKPGQMVRQEFGAHELAVSAETTMAAAAATAKALVEARFVMALRKPRDMDDVRVKLLKAIERPGFVGRANEDSKPGQAWYRKPIGKGVEGFSIRFAEEAMRAMGNIDVRPTVVWEDSQKRLIDVMVLDLESNIAFTQTVVVPKTVERSSLQPGEVALRTRINSYGKPVYLREALEDEIVGAQNAAISKIMRNEILRILPGDIQAACRERIQQIRLGDAATNPEGVKKEVVDAFAKLNVMPSGLKQYLGHELETASPAELAELRDLYKAIANGETSWREALHAALAERGDNKPPADEKGEKKPGLEGVKDKLREQQQGDQPPAAAEPPAEPEPDPAAAPDSAIASGAPPSVAEKKDPPAGKKGQRRIEEA